jgi:hypothetical protein
MSTCRAEAAASIRSTSAFRDVLKLGFHVLLGTCCDCLSTLGATCAMCALPEEFTTASQCKVRAGSPTRRHVRPWSSISDVASAGLSSGRAEAQRSDHGTTSDEYRQLCDCQLHFLSEILSPRGKLVASVYIRVPSSLHRGDLELERVTWTPTARLEHADAQESIFIGGAGSKLTEELVISHPTMSLPRRGHVVLPLSSNGFLVRPRC